MFTPNNRQSDILERFRIKAHMRRYVQDPFEVDENLMLEGIDAIKGLEIGDRDPAHLVAARITLKAFETGYYRREHLTEEGNQLVSEERFRRSVSDTRSAIKRHIRMTLQH